MNDDAAKGVIDQFDLVGVGFGPSNLALAVCAREQGFAGRCVFFEQNPEFQWHPGMLLPGSRMQISFLKDLVSLRNLASPYTFLQYVNAKGRLEHFVNVGRFRPTRHEYQDYLRWVAADFGEQVRYRTAVRRVTPVAGADGGAKCLFLVETEDVTTGNRSVCLARNVVSAVGGRPRKLADGGNTPVGLLHSSEFVPRLPALFPDSAQPFIFAVVGSGQSAGEIVAHLLERYTQAQVHLVVSGYALRPTDNSQFVNEQFFGTRADEFAGFDEQKRAALLPELRNANYGVVEEGLLEQLYDRAYLDAVEGRQRLFIHRCSRLEAVREATVGLYAKLADRFGGAVEELRCDGVVLATGYDRKLDAAVFGDVAPYLVHDDSGHVKLSRSCRAESLPELLAGLYVQGLGESTFGIGDTLLSLLPFRSFQIIQDVSARTPQPALAPNKNLASRIKPGPRPAKYPPRSFVETDPEKLYAVMERFRFATVISARAADESVVTQLPLTLDRRRSRKGVLFGHMDKTNPHVDLLDGRKILALFHGPNAYISPKLSRTNALPTWNSMTVRVHGHVTVTYARDALVRNMCALAERADPASPLRADDPRIDRLIDFVVGFEIEIEEIIGRFKLSQDKSEPDRRMAALAMARYTEAGERRIIEYVVDLPLVEPVTNAFESGDTGGLDGTDDRSGRSVP